MFKIQSFEFFLPDHTLYSRCGNYIWVSGIYGHCSVDGKMLTIEDVTRNVLQHLQGGTSTYTTVHRMRNEMPLSLRKLPKTVFKRKIKQILFEILASEDCYIDLPVILQKVELNLFSS